MSSYKYDLEGCKYDPKVCKYNRAGLCRFGDKCKNFHPKSTCVEPTCVECALKGYHADCFHCKGTGNETTECNYFNTPRGCLKANCPFVHVRRVQRIICPTMPSVQYPDVSVSRPFGMITVTAIPNNVALPPGFEPCVFRGY